MSFNGYRVMTLDGQGRLVQRGSSAIQRKTGGFFELASTYRLPVGTQGLSVTSSVGEILGEGTRILFRVVGAKPETFVLDSRTASVSVTLELDASSSKTAESDSRQAR